MSLTGMPSVMQTISSMPAPAASMTASAANGGGTKMSEQFAPSFSRASATLLKTGKPSWVVPPLPGVTPPTTLVPYSRHCLAWNVPSRPVIPWTMTRVFLSAQMAIGFPQLRQAEACRHSGHMPYVGQASACPALRADDLGAVLAALLEMAMLFLNCGRLKP